MFRSGKAEARAEKTSKLKTTTLLFYGFNTSQLVNTDTEGQEVPKRYSGHPVCHHPITCCQTP